MLISHATQHSLKRNCVFKKKNSNNALTSELRGKRRKKTCTCTNCKTLSALSLLVLEDCWCCWFSFLCCFCIMWWCILTWCHCLSVSYYNLVALRMKTKRTGPFHDGSRNDLAWMLMALCAGWGLMMMMMLGMQTASKNWSQESKVYRDDEDGHLIYRKGDLLQARCTWISFFCNV